MRCSFPNYHVWYSPKDSLTFCGFYDSMSRNTSLGSMFIAVSIFFKGCNKFFIESQSKAKRFEDV